MMSSDPNYYQLRESVIGTVEFVSPKEIKVLLNDNSPQNTALNTGSPMLFPKINGFVLIPNEAGALVGIVSWIGIEHSAYPSKTIESQGIVNLPFPSRKLSVSPLGILKREDDQYIIERGVYNYPSVGDAVILPSDEQLRAIVENRDENAVVKIGTSPLAANAPVFVNPDKLFGRHIAVLGNTGSGKSCSVAGLIRWSIEAVKEKLAEDEYTNARFIILDPNGEYTNTFDDIATVRKFKVFPEEESDFKQLRVPVWLWNSYEWSSIAQATGKTQRPILRRALREMRLDGESSASPVEIQIKRFLNSLLISLKNISGSGISSFAEFPGKQNTGELLKSAFDSMKVLYEKTPEEKKTIVESLLHEMENLLDRRKPNPNGYYPAFNLDDLEQIINKLMTTIPHFGKIEEFVGPSEDAPVYFDGMVLPDHIERISQEQNVSQYLDFMVMRIRTMLADSRMSSVISSENDIDLVRWLESYIGSNNAENGEIAVIDLSLVPADILHIVVAVISRMTFEALQRYRRMSKEVLPTVLVMEEAHNFVSRYYDNTEFSPAKLCTESFEKIAKEGRKFGLGLMLSSQRPSELAPTVLSQCNTFLLHRIVNDKDQELVKRFVPDSLNDLLKELPILPTRKAILLGWAAPIPILVEINNLEESQRPHSSDPDFWDVWTRQASRPIDWEKIADEWQMKQSENMQDGSDEENDI